MAFPDYRESELEHQAKARLWMVSVLLTVGLHVSCKRAAAPAAGPTPLAPSSVDASVGVPSSVDASVGPSSDAGAYVRRDFAFEERCDRQAGSPESRRGWPVTSGAEVGRGALRGGVEIHARVESVRPGYDCGGAPWDCGDKLRPLEIGVLADDGTRLTLRDDWRGRGEQYVVGTKYAFSVVSCTGDAGAPWVALRGYLALGRESGAKAGCGEPLLNKDLESWPERALEDLSREKVEPGGFNTRGFFVSHFLPRPCSRRRNCPPQPPPHVVLGDAPDSPKHTLALQTSEPKKLPLGVAVRVSVVVCGGRSYGGTVNEGSLRAFSTKPD